MCVHNKEKVGAQYTTLDMLELCIRNICDHLQPDLTVGQSVGLGDVIILKVKKKTPINNPRIREYHYNRVVSRNIKCHHIIIIFC